MLKFQRGSRFAHSEAATVVAAAAAAAADSPRHRGSESQLRPKLDCTACCAASADGFIGDSLSQRGLRQRNVQRSLTDDGSKKAETGLRKVVPFKIFSRASVSLLCSITAGPFERKLHRQRLVAGGVHVWGPADGLRLRRAALVPRVRRPDDIRVGPGSSSYTHTPQEGSAPPAPRVRAPLARRNPGAAGGGRGADPTHEPAPTHAAPLQSLHIGAFARLHLSVQAPKPTHAAPLQSLHIGAFARLRLSVQAPKGRLSPRR